MLKKIITLNETAMDIQSTNTQIETLNEQRDYLTLLALLTMAINHNPDHYDFYRYKADTLILLLENKDSYDSLDISGEIESFLGTLSEQKDSCKEEHYKSYYEGLWHYLMGIQYHFKEDKDKVSYHLAEAQQKGIKSDKIEKYLN